MRNRRFWLVGLLVLAACASRTPPQVAKNKQDKDEPVAPWQFPQDSITSKQTARSGERLAFAITLCPKEGHLVPELEAFRTVVESPESSLASRVVTMPTHRCMSPPAAVGGGEEGPLSEPHMPQNDPSDCNEQICMQIAGIVDRPGPIRLGFATPSTDTSRPVPIIARLDTELPPPTLDDQKGQDLVAVVVTLLWQKEKDSGVAFFDAYSKRRRATAYPTMGWLDTSSHSTLSDKALYNPFLSFHDIWVDTELDVLRGALDPEEPATVPAALLLPPVGFVPPFAQWLARDQAQQSQAEVASLAFVLSLRERMAHFAPQSAALASFVDDRSLFAVWDRIDQLGSSSMVTLGGGSKDRAIRQRDLRELGLKEAVLRDLFAHGDADQLGVITHDLSLRDGTDLTLVLHLSHPQAAARKLGASFTEIARKNHGLLGKRQLASHTVFTLSVPGKSLDSAWLVDGEWGVLSNSPMAMERVLRAQAGLLASQAGSAEFRYLSRQPSASADGWLVLGSGFWAAQRSAPFRVAHRRRLLCAAQMQQLAGALVAFRRDRGTTPSLKDLIASRYLLSDDLRCPDGGTIQLEAEGVHCTVHGSLGSLTPVIDRLPALVKPTERDGFRESLKPENSSDDSGKELLHPPLAVPQAIEFSTHHGFSARIVAVRDPDSPTIQKIEEWVSAKPVAFGTTHLLRDTIASAGLVLDVSNLDDKQRGLGKLLKGEGWFHDLMTEGPLSLDKWFTGRVRIYYSDGSQVPPLLPLLTGGNGPLGLFGDLGMRLGVGAFGLVNSGTSYVTLELKDPKLARAAVESILAHSYQKDSTITSYEKYDLLPYRGSTVSVVTVLPGLFDFQLSYAILGKELVIANRREVLLSLIDRLEQTPVSSGPPPLQGQAVLSIYPSAFQKSADALESAWQSVLRRSCQRNLAYYELAVQAFGPVRGRHPALLRELFGFVPTCPDHGEYEYDAHEGGVQCSFHGRPERARQPMHLSPLSDISKLVRPVERLDWTFSTTDRTLESELRVPGE